MGTSILYACIHEKDAQTHTCLEALRDDEASIDLPEPHEGHGHKLIVIMPYLDNNTQEELSA
eukprot:24834-Eustigmatos_ZCMA.PRE.1